MSRPNDYDMRQLRLTKRILKEALKQVDFALEDGRSLHDIELRSMLASGSAAYASILSKRTEHRFAKERGRRA